MSVGDSVLVPLWHLTFLKFTGQYGGAVWPQVVYRRTDEA